MQKNRILLSLGLLAALSVGLIWFGLSQEVSPDSNAAPVSQAVPPTPVSQEDTPDPADWRLCLVNPWHPLPEGYQPQLTQVENGHQVDSRCAADLEAMLADCRAAGHTPLLCSSYRTQEKQTQLYNNLVQKQIARGNSRSEAMAKAAKEVAVPGTSGHQRAPAGPGRGHCGHPKSSAEPSPGGHRGPAVADGALLGVRLHSSLSP